MFGFDNSFNMIVGLSTLGLNIILIIAYVFKNAKDKTNIENAVRLNTKDITEIKDTHNKDNALLKESILDIKRELVDSQLSANTVLFNKIDKTNELLTELNINMKVFEERDLTQSKTLELHTKEIEQLKDKVRNN